MTEALTLPRTDLGYCQRMRLSESESLSRPDFLRSLRKVGTFTARLRRHQTARLPASSCQRDREFRAAQPGAVDRGHVPASIP